MKRMVYIACIIAVIGALMVTPVATATTRYVCAVGCEYTNIQTALDASSDGDTVFVYNGSYSGYFVSINKQNVTLKGEGADVVTYDGGSDCKITMTAGEAAASGCILEGFTITGAVAGMGLVNSLAPDCIVRNCVFDGLTHSTHGVQLAGVNTSFVNNVIKNSIPADGILQVWAEECRIINNTFIDNPGGEYGIIGLSYGSPASCILVNNTFIDNSGAPLYLYQTPNSIIARNNFSNNSDIIVYDPGENIKWYLNNFIDTSIGAPWGEPDVMLWNSTEQIEYVYGSNTYTNYLGNNWSDYGGADGDGDGIGDTTYEVPDGLGNDYRPLMAPFENYPAPGPPPEAKYYLVPENSSAAGYCDTTEVMLMLNTTVPVQSGKIDLLYTDCCANVTSYEPDAAFFEDQTPVLVPGRLTVGFAHWAGAVPTNQPAAVYHLGNFTVHCCNETVPCCETDLTFDDVGLWDETGSTPSFVTENGTFECVAVIVPPLTSITITPDTGITGQVSAYDIIVNTTGFKSLTVNIPAGFNAETPSDGEQIARVDLWWANEGDPHYGYVTFTANATDKMDVYAYIIGETSVTYRGMAVNYTEGATTSIKSPFGSHAERANLTLPQESVNGSLTISGLPETITNVTVSIGAFVQNPTNVGDYTFTAKAEGEAVGKSAAVTVEAPAVPGIESYAPSAAAISDTEDAARTFNVTVNQTVNVSWLINGTVVKEGTEEGVTEASYTNTSAVIGTWNVSAVASNTNGTVMQTWIWTVEAPSPCFIATAAYGTTLHEDIDVLRDFRDERLMTNPLGRTFVKTYYETSPPIADALREHEGLRTAVREGLIKPLVYVSRMFVEEDKQT